MFDNGLSFLSQLVIGWFTGAFPCHPQDPLQQSQYRVVLPVCCAVAAPVTRASTATFIRERSMVFKLGLSVERKHSAFQKGRRSRYYVGDAGSIYQPRLIQTIRISLHTSPLLSPTLRPPLRYPSFTTRFQRHPRGSPLHFYRPCPQHPPPKSLAHFPVIDCHNLFLTSKQPADQNRIT